MSREWGQRPRRGRRGPRVFKVAEVNRAVRDVLSDHFPDFWVEGEVSEFTQSTAGHIYFTLSDEQEVAQLKCVLFRADAQKIRTQMQRGARVRVRGEISFYPPRGNTQLVARMVVPAGEGDLAAKFQRIKAALQAEGLLSEERKRPLPRFPAVVGVVTSRSSAAVHDIIRVAGERAPTRLIVADCRTQGPDAPRSIVHALTAVQKLEDLDVVIVGRGGGSAEELWCFNDERVARAIAACRVPVVCGVGHETDVTIAELVADVRASTPSNAAELAVPTFHSLVRELETHVRQLQQSFAAYIDTQRLRVERLERRLVRPELALAQNDKRIQQLSSALVLRMRERLRSARREFELVVRGLRHHDPRVTLARDRAALLKLTTTMEHAMRRRLDEERHKLERREERLPPAYRRSNAVRADRFARAASSLDALSPLRVLERGYAIALQEGVAITDARHLEVDASLTLRLHRGRAVVAVQEIEIDE